MYILITYDVDTTDNAGARRLRNVAKACMNYGQRVQNSVFECDITEAQLATLKAIINTTINKETDSIRIYSLAKNYAKRVEVIGKETAYNVCKALII